MKYIAAQRQGHYDQLADYIRREAVGMGHSTHECTEACDPPDEQQLLAFIQGLTPQQRDFVHFLMYAFGKGFKLPITMWRRPPLDILPNAGGSVAH
jgi:hypothetical protein